MNVPFCYSLNLIAFLSQDDLIYTFENLVVLDACAAPGGEVYFVELGTGKMSSWFFWANPDVLVFPIDFFKKQFPSRYIQLDLDS